VTDQINLEDLSKDKRFELSVQSDTPEDAEARRTEKAEEGRHRRRIQFWIIMFAIVLVLIFVFLCVNALLYGTPDDKKWATSIVAAIASAISGGLVGFGFGKSTRG
jgi:type VI protein secretion system component VasF